MVVAVVVLILWRRVTEQRHKAIAVVLVQTVVLRMEVVAVVAQAQRVLLAQTQPAVLAVMALRPQ